MTQHTDKELDGERREDAGFVTPVKDVDLGKTIDEKIQPFAADHNVRVQDDENAVLAQTRSHATSASLATTKQKKPWYKTWNPLRWGAIPPIPKEPIVSREAKAGLWSKLIFSWMGPIMTAGYKRPLHQNDIWTVHPNRSAEPLTAKVQKSLKRRAARGDKYPLFWSLHEVFFFEFYFGAGAAALATILQCVGPFALRFLIQFAANAWVANERGDPAPPSAEGIGWAIGITTILILQSLGLNHFMYNGMMVGGQSRGVLIGLIYEKAMVISSRARAGDHAEADKAQEEANNDQKDRKNNKNDDPVRDGLGWGNGRIINLMSVHTYRIDQANGNLHLVWAAPLAILITLALLIVNLTYSALAGFALIAIAMPLLGRGVRSLLARRSHINRITDQRVSLTQEILQAVRFVKFFGWEKAFIDRLGEVRRKEIRAIQYLLALRNLINVVSIAMPIFASMVAFICFSLTQNTMPPAEIFSSLALFNTLRVPLNMLPLVIGQVADAWGSMAKVQEFLLEEDQDETAVMDDKIAHAVDVRDASFTWERTRTQDPETDDKKGLKGKAQTGAKKPTSIEEGSTLLKEREPFKLHDLSFQVGRNELVAVIGSVGSGKSSLLAALASDMRQMTGQVTFGASKSFCPQYAWIQNATLQENITMGGDIDKEWYRDVIHACALQADLDMLPHGDATEIGERGINISGGQKQRLNIARAIYFNADIVLMDDPLSAVDAHVGRHIFDNAILGLLKDKCRILATHQLWVLKRCDRIIWMENGAIQAIDSFDNLLQGNAAFRTLMETTDFDKKDKVDTNQTHAMALKDEDKDKDNKVKQAALMQQEERATASVSWSVYGAFIRASGTLFNLPIVLFLLLLSQGTNIMTSLWLSYWTSGKFGLATGVYLGVFAGLGFLQGLMMFLFSISVTILGTQSSKIMLKQAISRVLRAPMSFFDTTPLGRIMNRFSRDVDEIDNNLADALRMYLFTMVMIISAFGLTIAFFPFFAVALVPLYTMFILSAGYYRASAREVKRYESVLRSNIFAKFSEGLTGVATIRAYGLKDYFVKDLRKTIDGMNSAYYLTFANQRWLSIRLDTIGNLLVFTVGILVVTSRLSVNPSVGGLVLSYIMSIVQMLQFSVRQFAEVENGMNSVERLHYYGTKLEEEAPEHTIEVRPSWPEKGEIVFDNVEMRYRENLPLVLTGLSMHIQGGERIAVVGRTGAGKSSIISTLFRLVEVSSGSITIDGLEISTIGLHDLRSRIAIIPQDPTLFRGTVRSNLDPFKEHTDLELWSALRQADLVPAEPKDADYKMDSSRIHLDSIVEEEGLNFSLGQRQLMALARALVRNCQIIVCDEATSSVDMETDDKIQNTIATAFRGKTLLCIAHRLRTIIGYERICVMDAGRIAELDTPLKLWRKDDGIFRGMCDRSGIRMEDITRATEDLAAQREARPSDSSSSGDEKDGVEV